MRNIISTIGLFFMLMISSIALASEDSGKSTQWQFKLGVDERLRYEYRSNFDFNENAKDNGSLFFHRIKLNSEAVLRDENQREISRIYIEGQDDQAGGYDLKPLANQRDDFDLHQAYVAVYNALGSDVDVTMGRRELKYGSGRLIAQPQWLNRTRHFDTAVLHYHKSGLYGDGLYLQDVKYDDNNFNYSNDDEYLTGFYGGYQENKEGPLYEFYSLFQHEGRGTVTTKRYTVGVRLQAKLIQDVWGEIEAPYQFGEQNNQDIQAYALAATLWRNFESLLWKPKLAFEYDQASGDRDPSDGKTNTFVPLYGNTHEPYGILDFFRWQNMREIETSLTFNINEKLKLRPQFDMFWLDSKSDSWVNSAGTVLRNKVSGDRGYHVGNEISLRAYYELSKNVKLEGGYAHFFTGEYVKDTGADDDANLVYSQISFKY